MLNGAWRSESIIKAEQKCEPLLSNGTLMQRAAAGVANVTLRELKAHCGGSYGRRVLLLAGPGNNGADGLYTAVRLLKRGVSVVVWRTCGSVVDTAWQAFRDAGGREVDAAGAAQFVTRCDLVLDAVFGLGARPGLPAELAMFANLCTDLAVPVLSVDIPSGLDADSACVPEQTFQAVTTVTFSGARLAHILEPAKSCCGRVEVVDIGLGLGVPDVRAFGLVDLALHLPRPDATSDKYSRGVVGVDAGSAIYTGAGVLCAAGAVYAGAGMVRFLGPKPGPVRLAMPDVVAAPGRVQAWAVGSGWGGRNGSAAITNALNEGVPVVFDADALRNDHLPQQLRPDVILTPHAGELARLLDKPRGEVENDRLVAVGEAVDKFGCTVLLKGATQYVAGPDFPIAIAIPGPAWTAQAGSGDVLAGMCATYAAAGLEPGYAALCAASVQALAASRMPGPHPPHEVARVIPDIVAQIVR